MPFDMKRIVYIGAQELLGVRAALEALQMPGAVKLFRIQRLGHGWEVYEPRLNLGWQAFRP